MASLTSDRATEVRSASFQAIIIAFATYAIRPIRLLELAQCLAYTDPQDRLGDVGQMKKLIESFDNVLFHIKPDGIIAPFSVKADTSAEEIQAHGLLAQKCIEYLQRKGFSEVSREREHPWQSIDIHCRRGISYFTGYVGDTWFVHWHRARPPSKQLQDFMCGRLSSFMTDGNMSKICMLAPKRFPLNPEPTLLQVCHILGLDDYVQWFLDKPDFGSSLYDHELHAALFVACTVGHVGFIETYLPRCTDIDVRLDGCTLLHCAVQSNQPAVVRTLLKLGVSVSLETQPGYYWARDPIAKRKTALAIAAESGLEEIVSILCPMISNQKDILSALCIAIVAAKTIIANILVGLPGIDYNQIIDHITPLMCASNCLQVDMIRLLLAGGADPAFTTTDTTKKGYSSIHFWANSATRSGGTDSDKAEAALKLLLDAGASVHEKTGHGDTPLHFARDKQTVQILLSYGANPLIRNKRGELPINAYISNTSELPSNLQEYISLLAAATTKEENLRVSKGLQNQHSSLIDTLAAFEPENAIALLAANVEIHATDGSGNNAMHYAVKTQRRLQGFRPRRAKARGLRLVKRSEWVIRLLQLLCEAGLDINSRNKDGQTPLHILMADVQSWMASETVHSDFWPVLSAMLSLGADIEARDCKGQTPLYTLVVFLQTEHGKTHMLDALIVCGASLETKNNSGQNLLFAAYYGGNRRTYKHLVELGLDTKDYDNEGNSPYHMYMARLEKLSGSYKSHPAFSSADTVSEADMMCRNVHGRTPLHSYAIGDDSSVHDSSQHHIDQNWDIDPFDISKHVSDKNIGLMDNAGFTALHYAASRDPHKVARLAKAGANLTLTTTAGMSAFHIAAQSGKANVLGVLCSFLEDDQGTGVLEKAVNALSEEGMPPIYYACQSGAAATLTVLLDAGAKPNVGAALDGCVELARQIESEVACQSPATRPSTEDDVYPETSVEAILAMVKMWAPTITDVDNAIKRSRGPRNGYVLDQLQHLREEISGYELVMKGLQCEDCDESKETDSKWTLYIDSMYRRQYEVVEGLATGPFCTEVDSRGYTMLHHLASKGFDFLLSKILTTQLLEKLSRLTGLIGNSTEHLDTLLVAACRREEPNMAVIKLLVEAYKVDLDGKHFKTHKQTKGRCDAANETSTIFGDSTALHIVASGRAWWHGNLAIPYLLSKGANTEALNEKGETPLISALHAAKDCSMYNMDAIRHLLQAGADANATDESGQTCLDLAVSNPLVFQLLLTEGNLQTNTRIRCLVKAIEDGNVESVRILLQGGHDPNARMVTEDDKLYEEICVYVGSKIKLEPEQIYPLQHAMELLHPCNPWYSPWHSDEKKKQSRDKRYYNNIKDIMQLLLDHGAHFGIRYADTTLLHRLISISIDKIDFTHWKGVNLDMLDGRGATPLMIACRQNHRVTAKYLIDHGADVLVQDEDGMTALHHLVDSRVEPLPLPVWKQLMATPGLINMTCKRGNTALHYAMWNDYCPLVRELIAAGADVWATNLRGNNILHQFFADSIVWHHLYLLEYMAGIDGFQNALRQWSEDKVPRMPFHSFCHQMEANCHATDELIDKLFGFLDVMGFDWNVRDARGQTFLHHCIEGRNDWMVKHLLQRGLSPLDEDDEYRTPMDMAAVSPVGRIRRCFAER